MQIITNVMALNAQRNLNVTSHRMSKALEQLSSGLRINRAADDAAGLAISEKMRAQIRGMRQGLRNAQDGISMIQTAEGALSETHAILQRMRELAIQAGSTTLSASDRVAIAEELVTLKAEISNIASRTRFNGLDLLTGALSVLDDGSGDVAGATISDGSGDELVIALDVTNAEAGHTYQVSTPAAGEITLTNTTTGVAQTVTVPNGTTQVTDTVSINFDALGVKLDLAYDAAAPVINDGYTAADIATQVGALTGFTTTGDGNATFRVGSEITDNVTVAFADLRATALGDMTIGSIDALITGSDAVSTVAKADDLIQSIDVAFAQVSTQRAKLGAAQNQMETAVNSLGVAVENLSASESRIRDADIAQVSSDLVAQQIMQQAGVSVLSHANTAPQAVLQLLRG